jgi:crotonobetainyl-CoA:carnitine CoA-transferase CaiB-like acyl-CoA transferase
VSLVETMLWVNWKAISGAQAQGRAPTRRGAQAEFQVLRCVDGWIALVFTVTQFDAVVALIGHPVLREPRFATRESRMRHGAGTEHMLAPWFAARARDDIYAQAQARGVPLGPVFDPAELLGDAQHQARDFITTMAHPLLGELRMPRLPVRWGEQRVRAGRDARG